MTNNNIKKVSLIIPVYNEENHLQDFLEKIDLLQFDIPKELIFVDDASKDSSKKIIESFPFQSQYQLYIQDQNCGKGAALKKGIELATGDIIGIQDADFEYDMNDIHFLLDPIIQDKADVVFGSRFKKSNYQVFRTYHYLVNKFLTILSNLFSGLYLSDMETCYKFFLSDIIKNINLESNRFGFEPEITAKIAKLKIRILEIPISYYPRNYLEGKKITWKDGLAALRHVLYYNYICKTKDAFKPQMPRKYLLQKKEWL